MTAELEGRLRAAATCHAEAQAAATAAEAARAALVLEALAAGLSLRHVASLLGISHQRVAQIAASVVSGVG